MKYLLVLVCIAAIVGFTGLTHGAKKPKNDSSKGIAGTIASVGTYGFTVTTDKDDQTLKILCDNNTKFMQDGQPVKADVIKVGVKVGVVGTTDNLKIMANTVNILSTDDKKKKKE